MVRWLAGAAHSLALREDGCAFGWGAGGWGRLGTGSNGNSLKPHHISGILEHSGRCALMCGLQSCRRDKCVLLLPGRITVSFTSHGRKYGLVAVAPLVSVGYE